MRSSARAPVLPEHGTDGPGESEDAGESHGRHPVDDGGGRDGLIAERAITPVKKAFATGAAILVRIAGNAMAKKGRQSRNNRSAARPDQEIMGADQIAEAHIDIGRRARY